MNGMRYRLPSYLWLVAAWLIINPVVSVALSAPMASDALKAETGDDSAKPNDAPTRIEAADGVFQTVAYSEQTSSLPSLKQEFEWGVPKVALHRPLPKRLSRLRAGTAISNWNAFLAPDTLQACDVRLQI